MIDLLIQHRAEIANLCRNFHVRTLEAFGSAADGNWDPNHSDLDFLVDFMPEASKQIAADYFGLLHALEDLFALKVDLVMERAIRNPYLRKSVDRSRRRLYAA